MRCRKCRYALVNLSEHRCPECGTAFDPDDPSTFIAPGDSSSAGLSGWWICAIVPAVWLVRLAVQRLYWPDDFFILDAGDACMFAILAAPIVWLLAAALVKASLSEDS